MTVSDEYLYSHLPQAERALMARVPPEGELSHEFSRRFRRRMSALIRHERHSPAARTAAKLGRIAAVLLLTLAVSFGAVIGTDTEARAEFLAWVMENYDRTFHYSFFTDQSEFGELPTYKLGWLPEGYAEVDRDDDDYSCFIAYFNEDEDMLYFQYFFMHSGAAVYIFSTDDTEEVELIQTEINGFPADIYISSEPEEMNHLLWVDEENLIMFMVGGLADESLLLHLAESVYLAD
ncbi:MAG: DUF4367 domain-containing protein [Oscillospiraceae bacterium]|nr:DUF4367 domain-containing protein [Oscillospiraceae bacterium]